jgi:iron-sulfur cluster assembly protein
MVKRIVEINDNALERIVDLMQSRPIVPKGLRISLKTKGCSGLSWNLDFIDEIEPRDELVEFEGLKVYLDPKAILFIIGSSIAYVKTDLEEGFVFENPNEKGKCGCGESFTI